MKQVWQSPRQLIILSSILLMGVLAMTSCTKSSNSSASGVYAVSGSGNGTQVVPSVSGSGYSNMTGTFDANTRVLNYSTTWSGLTGAATNAGFYSGAVGTNGDVVTNTTITTSGSTGAAVGAMTLTDAQAKQLLSGNWYYKIGTNAHASGEVRGQIIATQQ
jgi:hypothetical protein